MTGFSRKRISTYDEVRAVLESEGLTIGVVTSLTGDLHDAYGKNPTLPMFVLKSIFRDLMYLWDDNQAVPTACVTPFVERFLPVLKEWLRSTDTFNSPEQMNRAVRVFRDCQIAIL